MSDIRLFRLEGEKCSELEGRSVALEKSLQTLIERHLEALLGVRFLASEYTTSKAHGGRMDTLGIDENGCPVIIEYKRSSNENVINQGLFYLDWLLDHQGTFELLVQKTLGKDIADTIDWSAPRLLCIAGDFTKYDGHAVQQINRNIELIRYRRYGGELLLFELVNAVTAEPLDPGPGGDPGPKPRSGGGHRSVSENLKAASPELTDLFESLRAFLVALGDDVNVKTVKFYFAFRRLKNFACVDVRPQVGTLLAYVKVDPGEVVLEDGFTRDMREIGHYGTGDLEITIKSDADLERAKPLLLKSYEAS